MRVSGARQGRRQTLRRAYSRRNPEMPGVAKLCSEYPRPVGGGPPGQEAKVADARLVERGLECRLLILRLASGAGKAPDIGDKLDSIRGEDLEKSGSGRVEWPTVHTVRIISRASSSPGPGLRRGRSPEAAGVSCPARSYHRRSAT